MQKIIILDFDGVLFDSLPEVYKVCGEVCKAFPEIYNLVTFKNFKEFRPYLTDAWQFNRLLSKEYHISNYSEIKNTEPNCDDWNFNDRFFEARQRLMINEKIECDIEPYYFFNKISETIKNNPKNFIVLSTRNEESIQKKLASHNINPISVYGQKAVRQHGSKLAVIESLNIINDDNYIVYIDDMKSHLQPFLAKINLCLQADWGYDEDISDAYSQTQILSILQSYFHKNQIRTKGHDG